MTPHISPMKSNIAHGRSRYSETEKNRYAEESLRQKKSIFVYIRRSTTNKQELSLQRQEDDARETIRKNGFDTNEVEYYIESRSAYDGVKEKNGVFTRKRTEFTRMLADIDKTKELITILAYEPSRLSRNQIDEMEITERLFGTHNKSKQKIKCIKFNNKDEWNQKSNPGEVRQALLDCYKESLRSGIRSKDGQIRQLRNGRYTYSTPRGIDRLKKGESALKTNAEMPQILKAWHMKAENKEKREITKYLAKYGIRLSSFETYFRNTLYKGEVADPETGEMKKVQFEGGKPPISEELFNRVQRTLGTRRVSKHQEGDTITRLLKWEHDKGKAFTSYFAKGKYKTYKSNAYGGFDMSERKVVKMILDKVLEALFGLLDVFYCATFVHIFDDKELKRLGEIEEVPQEELEKQTRNLFLSVQRLPEEERKQFLELFGEYKHKRSLLDLIAQGFHLDDLKKKTFSELSEMNKLCDSMNHPEHLKFISSPEYREVQNRYIEVGTILYKKFAGISDISDFWFEHDMKSFLIREMSQKLFKNYVSSVLPLGKQYKDYKEGREEEKQSLIQQKEEKLQKKKQIAKDALLKGYTADIAEEVQADIQKEIEIIDEQISKLSESVNIEEFFDRLPEVLAKTFELSSRVLSQEENEVKREELYKVIELATFELNPITKKELKIKLFPVLEAVKKNDKFNWQGGSESNGDQGLWRSLY